MNFNRLARPYTWLTDHQLWRDALQEVARQLPPSGATLRLLDVSCGAGTSLRDLLALRPGILPVGVDLAWGMVALGRRRYPEMHFLHADAFRLPIANESIDAVLIQRTYYFLPNKAALLAEVRRVLRPGGRLVMLDPQEGRSPWSAWRVGGRAGLDMFALHLAAHAVGGYTPESIAWELETAGFVRLLAEPLMDGWVVMSRGEKPYPEEMFPLERPQVQDTTPSVDTPAPPQKGRYVYVLVRQTPNIPAWKLEPDDEITWEALALGGETPTLLTFSSLPKVVSFMQAAVLAELVEGVNKVGKFDHDTAAGWGLPTLLNPDLESLREQLPGVLIAIDHTTAAIPDE